MAMRIVIAGGTGFLGSALVDHWQNQHHITVIGRSLARIRQRFADRVQAVTWNQLHSQPDALRQADVVINLCGANIGAKRWTKTRKQDIVHSRIKLTHLLAELCAKQAKPGLTLINASAIGVYGLQTASKQALPPALDEDTLINFHQYPDFLSYVARHWERACRPALQANVRVIKLRTAVVLATHGGAFPKLYLPFKFFLGGPIGSGDQPFSWIALPDYLRALDFLIAHQELSGPVNIVAPGCVTQRELAKCIGQHVGRPSLFPLPALLVKLFFGQMGEELLLKGQRVRPKRLLDAGFNFNYATIDAALTHLFSKEKKSHAPVE